MQKIPTVFERDWNGDRSRVTRAPHADCTWVLNGEGFATVKMDGTCALIRDGRLFKRREIKASQQAPEGFEVSNYDTTTGKIIGWLPVGDGPEDMYFREAFANMHAAIGVRDGTYELMGPKIQGNPEAFFDHRLVSHDALKIADEDQPPRDFEGLYRWLIEWPHEGVVFHHPDGRMAKLKRRDFGLDWPIKAAA